MLAAHQQEPPASLPLLNLQPPGFSHSIDVPFPESKLPVCEACKKNYKTRELCRTRDSHKGLPWNTSYICISLDQSCTDSNGKLHDQPFTARPIPTQPPYCFKQVVDAALPICGPCKEKNYTRQYCREKLRHKQLPWGSVYAVLSVASGGKKGAGQKEPFPREGDSKKKTSTTTDDTSPNPETSSLKRKRLPEFGNSPPQKVEKEADLDVGVADQTTETSHIFENAVDESRTFLAIVSSSACTYEWLQVDSTAASANPLNDDYLHLSHSTEASDVAYSSQHRAPYYGALYPSQSHHGYHSTYPSYHQPPPQDQATWYSHQHSAHMPYGGFSLQHGQHSPHTPGYTYYPPSFSSYDPPLGPHGEGRQRQGPPLSRYGVRSAGISPLPEYSRQPVPTHPASSHVGPPESQQSWQHQIPPQQYSFYSHHNSRYGYPPPLQSHTHQRALSEGHRMPPSDESPPNSRDNERRRGRMS